VELPKIEARCCTEINIAFEICFKWQSLVGLCSSSVVVQSTKNIPKINGFIYFYTISCTVIMHKMGICRGSKI